MIPALVLLPVLAGTCAFFLRADRWRRGLLVAAALGHLSLVAAAWARRPGPAFRGWLALDDLGLLFLSLVSVLFMAAAVYAVGYLAREERGRRRDFLEEGVFFANAPEALFTGFLLHFLATMTLVTVSHHFGLLWVAVEATTLASAPLIFYHRHHRSLEAAWKYLMICSVGIALALLGTFFLQVAAARGHESLPLVLGELLRHASAFHVPWLKAAFILLLVGYGTKMGLAPLHTWLPDAHGESPSVVSALLSGALLNCAFLGVLRALAVCDAAGQGEFARGLLVLLGLLSMLLAGAFILGQADFKRLLAYSSVEHMGILALGAGLGGAAAFGTALHAVNHSLTKAMLFLVSGNLLAAYRTKSTGSVRGAARVLPVSGPLWMAGFLAITGTPPFGPFLSELAILKGALDTGRYGVAAAYLALLALVFVGMAGIMLRMSQGEAPAEMAPAPRRESLLAVLPPAALGALVLLLGLWIPSFLRSALDGAAALLGGR